MSLGLIFAWGSFDHGGGGPAKREAQRVGLPPPDEVPAQLEVAAPAEILSLLLTRNAMPAQPVLLYGSPDRAQAVAASLLRGLPTSNLVHELNALGLALLPRNGGRTLLREPGKEGVGLGSYLLVPGGAPVLLQAPHSDTDLDTGRILDFLLVEGNFASGAWNSVPRAFEADGGRVNADLTRAPVSFFNSFGLAFAEVHPEGLVVQIHGHAREKRRSAEGRSASVIVSSGTHEPSAQARAVANCLAATMPEETVRLFPEEVCELGATINTNGRALRAAGFSGFVHLELSRELRWKLVAEAGLRARLAACLRPL
ncbi:hypothetical protein EF888_19930 [Silicimonas algicola]|uniref:Uncharacterized protein n=1 Tax=Silicimonas algicola TaxID=1826607 RepID=A0A316G4Z0_9RHOB|nr:hypothetical protein [Silicimonas algicola]AZQ69201.1 hypothetical protein EF888_19930 [Silicimonas algicola]PWK54986.1 hypothetical protein C8D95_10973 [Silicimonas algicola]